MISGASGTHTFGRNARAVLGAAVGLGIALSAAPAAAVVAYDEGVSGDLSNSGASPTNVSFVLGDNIVSGTSGRNPAGAIDRDYFTFTVAPNQYLTAILLQPGTVPIGLSFIGIESGSQVTLDPATTSAAGLLGWAHYSLGDVGTDILDNMSIAANGSSGFTPPLGPGTYAVWVQEASSGTATYSFDFQLSVPEPSTWAMMLAGFGLMGLALRRKRQRALATA
jgi:hypothetical protein